MRTSSFAAVISPFAIYELGRMISPTNRWTQELVKSLSCGYNLVWCRSLKKWFPLRPVLLSWGETSKKTKSVIFLQFVYWFQNWPIEIVWWTTRLSIASTLSPIASREITTIWYGTYTFVGIIASESSAKHTLLRNSHIVGYVVSIKSIGIGITARQKRSTNFRIRNSTLFPRLIFRRRRLKRLNPKTPSYRNSQSHQKNNIFHKFLKKITSNT